MERVQPPLSPSYHMIKMGCDGVALRQVLPMANVRPLKAKPQCECISCIGITLYLPLLNFYSIQSSSNWLFHVCWACVFQIFVSCLGCFMVQIFIKTIYHLKMHVAAESKCSCFKDHLNHELIKLSISWMLTSIIVRIADIMYLEIRDTGNMLCKC